MSSGKYTCSAEGQHIVTLVQAFPPGKYFKVPNLPNVTVVNELGDFDIEADRLAIIDGEGTVA